MQMNRVCRERGGGGFLWVFVNGSCVIAHTIHSPRARAGFLVKPFCLRSSFVLHMNFLFVCFFLPFQVWVFGENSLYPGLVAMVLMI